MFLDRSRREIKAMGAIGVTRVLSISQIEQKRNDSDVSRVFETENNFDVGVVAVNGMFIYNFFFIFVELNLIKLFVFHFQTIYWSRAWMVWRF